MSARAPTRSPSRSRWSCGSTAPAHRDDADAGQRHRARPRLPPVRGHHPRRLGRDAGALLRGRRRLGESGFEENTYNVIDVTLAPGVAPPSDEMARNFFTSSSCGVCGKASIEQLRARTSWPVRDDKTRWPAALIAALPDKLRTEQRSFEKTGGLHAAGLYGPGGEVLVVREDVGTAQRGRQGARLGAAGGATAGCGLRVDGVGTRLVRD